MEDLHSAKVAAVNFVHELCKQRTKGNLDSFMQLLVQVMTEYQVSDSPLLSVGMSSTGVSNAACRILAKHSGSLI